MTVGNIFLLCIGMLFLFSLEYKPLRKSNNIIKDYFIDTTSNFKSKVTNNHHITHRGGVITIINIYTEYLTVHL